MPNTTNGGQIKFDVGFNVDKSQLDQIKKSFREIYQMGMQGSGQGFMKKDLEQAKTAIDEVQKALERAYNPKLNTLNVSRFNEELSKSGYTVKDLYNSFAGIGTKGKVAFNNLASSVLLTNKELKQTKSIMTSLGETMANTVKWGVASSIMNSFSNSISSAYNYIKVLDSSLNDIRIVTGQSKDEMAAFAVEANKAAQSLGRQTKDYTKAALVFYQQGLSSEEVKARSQTTLKASNITGQDAGATADQLTAVWNGYNIAADKTALTVSKMAAVADSSASDMSELAKAMSKVAAVANNMGVDIDQLNAQIATITQVTRQAPETTGNALKTIFARINDIKTGAADAETTLGNYSGKMAQLGINVLDTSGKLRSTGDVITEVGKKWETMSKEQQIYLAQTMAGQRQMNNLITLFDHWNTYEKMLNVSMSANNELNEKNDIHMQSLTAHMKQFEAAQEKVIQNLTDADSFMDVIDLGTGALDVFADLVDAIGGGGTALLEFGSVFTQIFSGTIAKELNAVITNFQAAKQAKDAFIESSNMVNNWKDQLNLSDGVGQNGALQNLIKFKSQNLQYEKAMTQEQRANYNESLKNLLVAEDEVAIWEEKNRIAKEFFEKLKSRGDDNLLDTEADFNGSLDNLKGSAEALKSISSDLNKSGKTVKALESDCQNLNNLFKSIADATEDKNLDLQETKNLLTQIQQRLEAIKSKGGVLEDDPQITRLQNQLKYKLRRQANNIDNAVDNFLEVQRKGSDKETDRRKEVVESRKKNVEDSVSQTKQQVIIQNYLKMAGAIGQVTSSMQGLASIWDTMTDKNLTGSQKVLRVIQALGFTLPNLVLGAKTLNDTLNALTLTKAKDVATTAAETGATTAQTVATEGAAAAQQGLNAAIKANPIGLIITAVLAAITVFNLWQDSIKKARQEIIKTQNEEIDKSGKRVKQIESETEALENYLKVYDRYKQNEATQDDLAAAAEALSGQLDQESLAVARLTGNYDLLADSIIKAREEKWKSEGEEGRKQVKAINEKAESVLKQAGFNQSSVTGHYEYGMGQVGGQIKDYLLQNSDYFKSNGKFGVFADLEEASAKEIAGAEKEIDRVLEEYNKEGSSLERNEEAAKQLQELKNALSETASQYKEATDLVISSNGQLEASKLDFGEVTNLDEFEEKKAQLIEALRNSEGGETLSDDELNKAADEYISNISASAKKLVTQSEAVKSIFKKFEKELSSETKKKIEGLSEKELSVFLTFKIDENASNAEIDNYIKQAKDKVASEEITANEESLGNISDIVRKTHDERHENTKNGKAKITAAKKLTTKDAGAIDDLMQQGASAEQIAILKDETATMTEQLTVVRELRQANMDKAKATIDSLEEENAAQKKNLEEELARQEKRRDIIQEHYELYGDDDNAEALDRVNKLIDSLKERLDNEDFSIKLQLDMNDAVLEGVQSKVDNIRDDTYLLSQAAMLVGQGYKVAADDVQALFDIFPELQNQAQVLADGSIQLNQQVVQDVLQGKMDIVTADGEAATSQIQTQLAITRAAIESNQTKIDILDALLNGEITEAEAAEQINQTQYKFEQDVANAAGQSVAEAAKQGTDALQKNANNAILNLDAIGKQAETVAAAVKAAYAGEDVNYQGIVAHAGAGGVSNYVDQKHVEGFAAKNNVTSEAAKKRLAEIADMKKKLQDQNTALKKQEGALIVAEGQINKTMADARDKVNKARSGQGGAANTSGGGSGKGKGGGAGKQAKSADEVLKDLVTDADIDRYHKIERELKEISRDLDKIGKFKNKTINEGLAETLEQENKTLEGQIELYKQKNEIAKQANADEAKILTEGGVQFDASGEIMNYIELQKTYQTQYNEALQRAAKETNKDAQDKILEEAKIIKDNFNTFKKQMDDYEKNLDLIQDTAKAIEEAEDKMEENRIQAFKVTIDFQLNLRQAERDWNEFRKEIIDDIKEDDYVGIATSKLSDFDSYYNDNGTGTIQKLAETVEQITDELRTIDEGGQGAIYGRNEQKALEDLKNYQKQLMDGLKDVKQMEKEIEEAYLNGIDNVKEKLEEEFNLYKQIGDILEHNANLVTMLYGEENYEVREKYYDLQAKNNNEELAFYRKEVDMWKAEMDAAEEGSKEWKKFKENWMSALSEMNEAVETATQNLIDKYENAINKIVKNTKNKLVGTEWQDALDEWDRAKWADSRYLDKASRAAGTLDFANSVKKAMNDQSPRVQKQLNDFLESELDHLNNITTLRQIDLDIANKKLEVIQKQIALEDVQNNKTKMRLRRDSQGNYTYQYVADEDAVADKQQELRDSLEELRQLVKQDSSDTLDELSSKIEEFFEKATDLATKYKDDSAKLQEEQKALYEAYFGADGEITRLGVDYHEMQSQLLTATGAEFSTLLEQMGNDLQAFLGLGDSADDQAVWSSIQALMGDGGKIPTLLDSFTTDVYETNLATMSEDAQNFLFGAGTGLNPSWNTATGNMGDSFENLVENVVIPAMGELMEANSQYEQDLEDLEEAAGINFQNIADGIDPAIEQTNQLKEDTVTLFDTYKQELSTLADVKEAFSQMADAERDAAEAAREAVREAKQAMEELRGIAEEQERIVSQMNSNTVADFSGEVRNSGSSGGSGSGSGGGAGGGGSRGGRASAATSNTTSQKRYTIAIHSGVINTSKLDRTVSIPAWNTAQKAKYFFEDTKAFGDKAKYKYRVYYGNKVIGYTDKPRWEEKTVAFRTGGYTGSWSDGSRNGKLAMLHQKELVLNENDTKNFLDAAKIMRSITSAVGGMNSKVFSGIKSFFNIGDKAKEENSTQNIVINADFPNANSADEIKQAFNELVNMASQRANNNRRRN